jgi:hypothetical protein
MMALARSRRSTIPLSLGRHLQVHTLDVISKLHHLAGEQSHALALRLQELQDDRKLIGCK